MEVKQKALFDYLLWLGDNGLILGQRIAEWCGHGPYLEEDIALTNISLDLIGQARAFLSYAGELEGKGRDEDKLAFFRNDREFKNNLLVEEPNGDFGKTILRQYFFSVFAELLFEKLSASNDEKLAALAAKSLKEVKYHKVHSQKWLLRLGDGTPESHSRMQAALNEMWHLTGDLFENAESDNLLFSERIAFDLAETKPHWSKEVISDLLEASLQIPTNAFMLKGGRNGFHSEHLSHILTEMQALPRAIPEGKW